MAYPSKLTTFSRENLYPIISKIAEHKAFSNPDTLYKLKAASYYLSSYCAGVVLTLKPSYEPSWETIARSRRIIANELSEIVANKEIEAAKKESNGKTC